MLELCSSRVRTRTFSSPHEQCKCAFAVSSIASAFGRAHWKIERETTRRSTVHLHATRAVSIGRKRVNSIVLGCSLVRSVRERLPAAYGTIQTSKWTAMASFRQFEEPRPAAREGPKGGTSIGRPGGA